MRRNIKCLLLVLIICTLAFFGIQEIRAVNWGGNGNSSVENFDSCDTSDTRLNGCIGRFGFRFTVVKNVEQGELRISFEPEDTGKYTELNIDNIVKKDDDLENLEDVILNYVKSGYITTILKNANVSESEFFDESNRYSILVEPLYTIYYWNYKVWNEENPNDKNILKTTGISSELASTIKNLIESANMSYNIENSYNGWYSVIYMLLCDLYISGTKTNEYCVVKDSHWFDYYVDPNGRMELLNVILSDGSRNNLFGKMLISASDLPNPQGKLDVKKYDFSNPPKLITSSQTEFNIYNGNSCSGTVIKSIITNGGIASTPLAVGTYSINEKTAPENYEKSDNCRTFTISSSVTTTVNFFNDYTNGEDSCKAELEKIKSSSNYNNKKNGIYYDRMRSLILAYIKFANKGVQYKGLLNFDNPSCNTINSTTTTTSGCLSGSIEKNGFSKTNWSNFDTFGYYEKHSGVSYDYYYACSNNFKFTNYRGLSKSNTYLGDFKSGQMWLSAQGPWGKTIGTGELTYTCYGYADGTENRYFVDASNMLKNKLMTDNPSSNYYNYIRKNNAVQIVADKDDYDDGYLTPATSSVKTGSTFYELLNPELSNSNKKSEIYWFDAHLSLDYNLPEICAVKGTGAVKKNSVCNAPIPPMTMLGYGFTINFDANSRLYFPKFKVYNKAGDVIISSQCYFGVTNDITTPNGKELNIEFRSVEPNNAFPGQSGNSRSPGTNWSILSLDANKDGQINMNDWASVVRTSSNSTLDYNFILKYDFNKNGVVGDEDLTTLRNIISKYVSNGTDTYADTLLQNTPNSYGLIPSTGERKEAKYTIVLTPNDIKTIRNDNNHYQYGLNVSCNDDKCTSSFLTTLTNRNSDSGSKVLVIKNSLKRDNK